VPDSTDFAISIAGFDPDQYAALRFCVNAEVMTSQNLKRDIIVILSIKITIVLLAALFVFGPRQRPHRILNNSNR
jgi:hypothetical protein